jgi:hypothetical protein
MQTSVIAYGCSQLKLDVAASLKHQVTFFFGVFFMCVRVCVCGPMFNF